MLTIEDYKNMEYAWCYQDFITKELLKIGISVNCYQSLVYQAKYGESASGIEIKNDRRLKETGNLYIEFKQKSLRGNDDDHSGINRDDDSWLYVIGDYETIYIFGKSQLRSMLSKVLTKKNYYSQKYGITIRTHKNDEGVITSYGMVIPSEYVEKSNLAIRKIEVEQCERKTELLEKNA